MGTLFRLAVVASLLGLVATTAPALGSPDVRSTARTTISRPKPSGGDPPSTRDAAPPVAKALPSARLAELKRGFLQRARGARSPAAAEALPRMHPRDEALGGTKHAAAKDDPHTLLVHYAGDASASERRQAAEDSGGRIVSSIPELGVDVVSTEGTSRAKVASRLEDDPRVGGVETNAVRSYFDTPDDELHPLQWNLLSSRLPAAWDITHGSTNIDIAIVDSGVKLNHPDLVGRLVAGRDIVGSDSTPDDVVGHGTMVSGVAGADTDNALGVAGAGWNARIMPIKVGDAAPLEADIAAGIVWATDHDAEIINLSLGGPGTSTTLSDAIDYAISHGVVVVAAAGNGSSDVPMYPAAYPNVIAVGATDPLGDVVQFTSRGPWVDVVAQGYGVITTCMTCGAEEYGVADGTSFSSPMVAGVAALVLAKNPSFTPAQIGARLRSTAIDRGPRGIDDHYGWGLVDAYAAVGGHTAAAPPPAARGIGEPDDTAVRARAIGNNGTNGVISPEGDIDWFSYDAPTAGALTVTVSPPAGDASAPLSFDPEITAVSPALDDIGHFDATGPGQSEVAQVLVAAPGRYLLRVENFASSRSPGVRSSPTPYAVSATFATGAPPAPPASLLWVTDVEPAPLADGISPSVSPTVTFARALNEASLSETNVRLIDGRTNTAVAATRAYHAATKRLMIDPTADLVAGRPYVLRVNGVADTDANVMTEEFTSRFTVSAPAPPLELAADLNGDGFEDTVVGAPGEDFGNKVDGGAVHVLYGSSTGPRGSGSELWSQASSGIAGSVETGDRFGEAVATGDLNKDGFDDLVIGAPYEDLDVRDAGAVHVLLGSSSKLRASGSQLWTQDSKGIPGGAETGDRFGGALAVGDFDNVAGDDVAVGAPGEGVGPYAGAGAVNVIRGASGGLTSSGAQQWTQDSPGIEIIAQPGENFGYALAAGDTHGDTHDDLLIGSPSDNVLVGDDGSVTFLRGSIVGLRPVGSLGDFFSANGPEVGDSFGASVAIGDVGGYAPADGYADIVIGVPGQSFSSASHAGRVDVLYNDHSDLGINLQSLDQSSFLMSSRETNARFGSSLHARTFGSRGVLTVGTPLDDVSSAPNAGSVHVYDEGAPILDQGLHTLGPNIALTQNSGGVPGSAESGDRFGTDALLIDADGDDDPDLIAGTPYEGIGNVSKAGAFYSVLDVVGGRSSSYFTQDSSGVPGVVESGDRFGASAG